MVLEVDEIKKILPHRAPFLLVDRIIEIDHFHRNAIVIIVYCFNFCQINWRRFDSGKIEIICLGRRARYYLIILQIHLQSDI